MRMGGLGRRGMGGLWQVVPEVVARGLALELAMRRHRSPDGLQREQHQQEDGDETAHDRILAGFRFSPPT